jgi:hypothetical protein
VRLPPLPVLVHPSSDRTLDPVRRDNSLPRSRSLTLRACSSSAATASQEPLETLASIVTAGVRISLRSSLLVLSASALCVAGQAALSSRAERCGWVSRTLELGPISAVMTRSMPSARACASAARVARAACRDQRHPPPKPRPRRHRNGSLVKPGTGNGATQIDPMNNNNARTPTKPRPRVKDLLRLVRQASPETRQFARRARGEDSAQPALRCSSAGRSEVNCSGEERRSGCGRNE